jgi:hypothetical protein
MQAGQRIAILSIVLSASLGACRAGAVGGTPTLSPEQVISTAEAIAEMTRSAATPTATVAPMTPTSEPPTATATQAATATPESPIVTALFNANIRRGPDDAHPNVDFLLQGQTAEVIGQYNNFTSETSFGTWYQIRRIGEGLDGWVFGGAVSLSGDANRVPSIDLVPTPE